MKILFFNSLKFRMPLLVLSAIIPLISLASFYATKTASKTITEEAKENLVLHSTLLAENVQIWNESNVLALLNLSKEVEIISADLSKRQTVLETMVNTYEHLYLAHTINTQGWNTARSDGQISKYYGDRKYFTSAMAGNKINYQTIVSRTTKQPALCLSTPTFGLDKIVEVTSVCTDLNALTEQIGKLRFGETGYAFLVDENAALLAHPDEELISGDNLINFSEYPPVQNILPGNEDSDLAFTDDNDVRWVSYTTRLNNGWILVIQQEEAEFLANQLQFQNLAFFISLVLLFVITGVTFGIANRLIAPISNLTSAASAIAHGEFEGQITIKRQDELGILADSFNQMKAELKNLFAHLEQRIQERTAQLKTAKESAEKASAIAVAANQSKDRFLANISHEFRTPLNSIIGYNRLIQQDLQLKPIHSKHLKIVEQSSIHLLSLINDLLDLSQAQLDQIKLYPDDLEMDICLKEIIELVTLPAQEKNLILQPQWQNLPTWVQIDQKRLRQILVNLLSNAIKFTNKGKVTLQVSPVESIEIDHDGTAQQKIRFAVIDTGVGLAQQDIKKIFQPFEQAGDSESRWMGTGLGLSIVSELIKLMGGELRVKSKLGIGSVFWFDIDVPISPKTEQIEAEIPPISEISYQGAKPKLLVVDDQIVNRELLVKMLQPKGFDVFTASDGEQMLKIATVIKPDVILLDLFMPVKTGFTCSREIRQDPQLKNIPIIIVTASTISEEMSRYLDCEAIVNKPIDQEELLTVLHQYISKRRGSKGLDKVS